MGTADAPIDVQECDHILMTGHHPGSKPYARAEVWTMRLLLVRILLMTLAISIASGQQGGAITGVVHDATQAVIADANVTIFNEQTGFVQRLRSGNAGIYEAPYLPSGLYKITVMKPGFRTLVRFGVTVDSSYSARLDFEMHVGDIREVITVRDGPLFLNTADGALETKLDREWLERLPSNGRDVASLLALAPGSVTTPATLGEAGQFSVNGQRPNTNYFSVDGVSANLALSGGGIPAQIAGGSLPTMTAIGTLHSLASLDGLGDLQFRSASPTSESGRSSGGHIALNSRSGSPQWHGALSTTIRNEAFDANDWFANRNGNSRAPLRMLDTATNLGGPIRKDRTFLFVSYERLALNQSSTWRSTVPSLASRAAAQGSIRALLDAFPVPNGGDLGGGVAEWNGSAARPSQLNVGSLRIDHSIKNGLLLFGRYSDSASASRFGSPQINNIHLRTQSLTLGLTMNPRPSITNEIRINRSTTRAESVWRHATGMELAHCFVSATVLGPVAPCESYARVAIGGIEQLAVGTTGSNSQTQWQIVANSTVLFGAHQIRMGADYRQLTPERKGSEMNVALAAPSIEAALNGEFSATIIGSVPVASALRTSSSFVQDTWRPSERVALTAGLRWELNPAPMVASRPTGLQTPLGGAFVFKPAWSMRYSTVAPRLAAVLALTGDGRTLLRSAFGRYFVSDFGATVDGINGGPYNVWQSNQGLPYDNQTPVASPTMSVSDYSTDLRVPSVWLWNATLERAWTRKNVLSVSYVGSKSTTLLRRELSPMSSAAVQIIEATNHGASSYNSLQVQYRGTLIPGSRILGSYVWSHSIDNGSTDSAQFWYHSDASLKYSRGSSDFDVRHSAALAFSQSLSRLPGLGGILGPWSIDGIFRIRTGFPIDVVNADNTVGAGFADVFRPDRVYGTSIWVSDPAAPSGRRLNPRAFNTTEGQGNLGRNAVRGFGMSQLDVAIHREFSLTGKVMIEFRAEVFNVKNRPSLADPVRFLNNPLFGQSASMLNLRLGYGSPGGGAAPAFQSGGPRAAQLTLRLRF